MGGLLRSLMMRRRAAWSILMLVTVLTGFSLFSTEVGYIKFIEALRSIRLTVQNTELDASQGAVSARFVLLLENPMAAEAFLEAISYSLCLEEHEVAAGAFGARTLRCPSGQAFLGAYNTTEGSGLIKEKLQVPIATDLGQYAQRVDGPIYLAGSAQLKLQIGKSERSIKLPFRGVIHE